MKRNFICGLALLSLMACNKNHSEIVPGTDQIQLLGSVQATTKAAVTGPINSGFSTDFPIGVYAKEGAWLAGASANLINNDAATVAGAAGHNITFGSGPYYYPSDGGTVNFYAYAPHGTESTAAGAGTSPVAQLTITGQEDVMWATADGSKSGSGAAVTPTLNFAHKLAQLQFTFKSGTGYPTSGYSVVSLKVKSQPTTVNMTVGTGVCVLSGSSDMQALSTANQTAGIAISGAGTNALSPVMTQTATGASAYLLDIVVKPASGSNVTYSNVPVSLTSVAGSAHMVTITFTATAITASATVADWVSGTTGSATAQ